MPVGVQPESAITQRQARDAAAPMYRMLNSLTLFLNTLPKSILLRALVRFEILRRLSA